MDVSTDFAAEAPAIAALFGRTFAASEGAEEGALIAGLATRLMAETPAGDLRVLTASQRGEIVAAAIFSRLRYAADPCAAFVLGPVAVRPDRQGRGVGAGLLRRALGALRQSGVDVALTYGDPAYYARVGFRPITQAAVAAPYPLSRPEGWLGQSLRRDESPVIAGPARCVAAFADPAFW